MDSPGYTVVPCIFYICIRNVIKYPHPAAIMDILDGYHRYIGVSQVIRENPDFDRPWELRLCTFTEEKAKQFIFQNNQKNKMKRVDSNSMNQYSPANSVVEKLNSNPTSNLRGIITKTGNIDPAFLAAVIGNYYFSMSHNQEVFNKGNAGCG